MGALQSLQIFSSVMETHENSTLQDKKISNACTCKNYPNNGGLESQRLVEENNKVTS
jgi:hypothetical protein